MARRGQFGRYSPGASNLSSMISSLVSQQKSAEEALIIRQFRDGDKTYAEVAAFYDNWISAAGLQAGDPSYETMVKNKEDLYDESLIMRENTLVAQFKLTNGANYNELISFLTKEGQTANNDSTIQSFNQLIKDSTANYISFSADRLGSGAISVQEFNKIFNQSLNLAYTPGTQEYQDAMVSGLTAEYSKELSLLNGKIKANVPGALSLARNFLNKFQSQLSARGIDNSYDLYNKVTASINNVGSIGAARAANAGINRASAATIDLGKIFAESAKAAGIAIPTPTQAQIAAGQSGYGMADIIAHAEVFAAFTQKVNSGEIDIPQSLIDLGITSISDYGSTVDSKITKIANGFAAANGSSAEATAAASEARVLRKAAGLSTQADELKFGVTQYAADMQEAIFKNDTFAMDKIMGEYNKFLKGAPSDYGQIDFSSNQIPKMYRDAIIATVGGVNGVPSTTTRSLEDFFGIDPVVIPKEIGGTGDNSSISWSELYANNIAQQNKDDIQRLSTGAYVEYITPGAPNRVGLPSAEGAAGLVGVGSVASDRGFLNVLSFKSDASGKLIPVVQSIQSSNKVAISVSGMSSSLNPWGYMYVLSDGVTKVYASATGKFYTGWPFASQAQTVSGNNIVPLDATIIGTEGTAPKIDLTSIIKDPNNFAKIRSDVADAIASVNSNPMFKEVLNIGGADFNIETLLKPALDIADSSETKSINLSLVTIGIGAGRLDAAGRASLVGKTRELTGRISAIENNMGSLNVNPYTTYANNKSKYTDNNDGTFTLKPDYFGEGMGPDVYPRDLPMLIDVRTKSQIDYANNHPVQLGIDMTTPNTYASRAADVNRLMNPDRGIPTTLPPAPSIITPIISAPKDIPVLSQSIIDFRAGERVVTPPVVSKPSSLLVSPTGSQGRIAL